MLYTTDESENITSHNIIGPQNNIIATIRCENENEHSYFYNKDIRTSVSNIIDESGQAIASYKYGDYGKTTKVGELNFYNEICYTSGVYDELTELYYFNSRYYNRDTSTFITQDSYRGEIDSYETWNLYAYCGENPINYVDPSGHNAIAVPLYGYGVANVWNPTGWITLTIAGAITAGSIIYLGGKAYEAYKVRNISETKVRVKVKTEIVPKKSLVDINPVRTKGNENMKETDLIGIPEEELTRRLNDRSTTKKEKQKIIRHLKANKLRDLNKNRGKNKSKGKSKSKSKGKHK